MKKVLTGLVSLSALLFCVTPVFANEYTGGDGWVVYFNGDDLIDTFSPTEYDDVMYALQPGDTATFKVNIENRYNETVAIWMSNEVIRSFEDNTIATGGAYTYTLSYVSPSGSERDLFDSRTVGGETKEDGKEGLHEATNALDDFIYLDDYAENDKGYITLTVALDGESQGNVYQDTVAALKMNFAAELTPTTIIRVPNTGDTTNLMPYMVLCAVSGFVVLAIALIRLSHKDDEEETD